MTGRSLFQLSASYFHHWLGFPISWEVQKIEVTYQLAPQMTFNFTSQHQWNCKPTVSWNATAASHEVGQLAGLCFTLALFVHFVKIKAKLLTEMIIKHHHFIFAITWSKFERIGCTNGRKNSIQKITLARATQWMIILWSHFNEPITYPLRLVFSAS